MTPHKVLKSAYVHRRIKLSFGMYLVLSLVMLVLLVYKTIIYGVSARFAVVGFLFGVVIGILLSRMLKISWDHNLEKIISRIDRFGFVVLILFIAFDIFHKSVVGLFVYGDGLPIASFAVATGVLYGRVVGFRGSVRRILREQRVF